MKQKTAKKVSLACHIITWTFSLLAIAFSIIALSSCGPKTSLSWSEVLQEDATVSGKRYHGMHSERQVDVTRMIFDEHSMTTERIIPVTREAIDEARAAFAKGGDDGE